MVVRDPDGTITGSRGFSFDVTHQAATFERASQLGTVGSGNHYVNLMEDDEGKVWVGAHFGSRGFGHKTASGFLALQANRMGWFVHGMVGFDMDRAFAELNVPAGHRVEAAYAIGRKGDPATLPDQLRTREAPSGRKPLSELIFEGGFPAPS